MGVLRGISVVGLVCALSGCTSGGDVGLTGPAGKLVDEGPILASQDHAVLADRFQYHQDVISARGFSYFISDNPATHRDISELAGFEQPDVVPKGDPPPPLSDPPERWDAREQGVGLPPARDQMACGSCWAFSTVAALEAAVAMFDAEHVDLSEQYLIDCNGRGYGCGGGWWVHDMSSNRAPSWRTTTRTARETRAAQQTGSLTPTKS